MASSVRCSLVRPAPTIASQFLHQTASLLTHCTKSPNTSAIPAARFFSTTPLLLRAGLPRQGKPLEADGTESDLPIPTMSSRDPQIPAYPYGERQFYKQSNRGLYGHARIRFGNNVSEKHDVKTRRNWRPNVRRRRLWSEALRCMVQTKVTSRVLRTIDKCGGLDNYLLGEKPARHKELGPWGWKLRWRLMQTDVIQEKFRQQRILYGLEPVPMANRILQEQAVAQFYEESLRTEGAAASQSSPGRVDEMLKNEEEFAIGTDEGFMKEERP